MKSTKDLFDILQATEYNDRWLNTMTFFSFLCLPPNIVTKDRTLTDVYFGITERAFYPKDESRPIGSPFRFLYPTSAFGVDDMDLHGLSMIPLERAQIRIAMNNRIIFERFFYRNDEGRLWCSPNQWVLLPGNVNISIRVRFFDPDIRVDNLRLYMTGIEIFDLMAENT
jgi:hypothetical protein